MTKRRPKTIISRATREHPIPEPFPMEALNQSLIGFALGGIVKTLANAFSDRTQTNALRDRTEKKLERLANIIGDRRLVSVARRLEDARAFVAVWRDELEAEGKPKAIEGPKAKRRRAKR